MSLSIQQISHNKAKFPVVFQSLFGYNVMFRIGVIYNLTNKSNYIFIMRTYHDLIDLSYWFKLFVKKSRHYMKIKKLTKYINRLSLQNFTTYRSIGLISVHNYTLKFSGNYNIYPYINLHG